VKYSYEYGVCSTSLAHVTFVCCVYILVLSIVYIKQITGTSYNKKLGYYWGTACQRHITLEVTGKDIIELKIYDFLLTFTSNYFATILDIW